MIVATPIILIAILLFMIMGFDATRLYVVRGALQNQVNAAALAAVDAAQTCGGNEVALQNIQQRAFIAAVEQGFSGTMDELTIDIGRVSSSESDDQLIFNSVPDLEQTDSVRVSHLKNEAISRFFPGLLGSMDLDVSAVAHKNVIATLSAGKSSPIIDEGILGSIVSFVLSNPSFTLDANDIVSLQDTAFDLSELSDELGVSSTSELLAKDLGEVSSALSRLLGTSSSIGDIFVDLAVAAGNSAYTLQSILNINAPINHNLHVEIPAYETMIGIALSLLKSQSNDSGTLISLPINLANLDLPLVAEINTLDIQIFVNSAPKIAIGPTQKDENSEWITHFQSADLSLQIMADASLIPISVLGLLEFELQHIRIPIAISSGQGEGFLSSATCARSTENTVSFGVELHRTGLMVATGLVDVNTGQLQPTSIDATVGSLSFLSGLGGSALNIVHINADLSLEMSNTTADVEFGPHYPLYCSEEEGCDSVTANSVSNDWEDIELDININEITVLQSNFGAVDLSSLDALLENPINALLTDVTQSIFYSIVGPLLETLGISADGMSVTIRNAKQNNVVLIEDIR